MRNLILFLRSFLRFEYSIHLILLIAPFLGAAQAPSGIYWDGDIGCKPIECESPVAIDGPLEVCLGVPVTYTAIPNASGSYQAIWGITPGSGLFTGANSDEAIGDEVEVVWNPNYTGPYELRLRFGNDGCISPDVVVVHPVPLNVQYAFTGSQTVCSSTYETYSVDYHEGDKYEWKIITPDLGSIAEYPQDHEIEVLWNNVTTATTAILELSLEKCGIRHIQQYPVTILPTAPISINAPATACRGEAVHFSLNGLSSWADITWDFGDGYFASGPSPAHPFNTVGNSPANYVVKVSVTQPNGCILPATADFTIQIMPVPVAGLSTAKSVFCDNTDFSLNKAPLTIHTNPGTTISDYTSIEWFYNGSPLQPPPPPLATSHTPAQTGTYYARITYKSGCADSTNPIALEVLPCTPPVGCTITEPPPVITSVALTACNMATATAQTNSTATPISVEWRLDGVVVPGQGSSTVNFNVVGAGLHTITYREEYAGLDSNGNPCTAFVSGNETFLVPYRAYLSYSFTCNSSGTGYDITIFDTSDYFPYSPPTPMATAYFIDASPQPGGNNQPQYTTSLLPGPHTLELEISGYSTPNNTPIVCRVTKNIVLPDLPTAIINAPLEACAGVPVQFTATVNDPNITYLWDFNDGAKNSLPDPIRNFDGSYSNPTVSLTITNSLGCSITVTHPITIHAPDMAGTLSLSPATVCYGDPIKIKFDTQSGFSTPLSFIWNREVNGATVYYTTTTVDNINVTQPGIYILDGVDGNGCIRYGIARVAVSFLETPNAVINGPLEVCAGNTFQLYASPFFESNYQYSWELDGQPLPQWDDAPVIDQTIPAPGNYTYQLTVTAPSLCSATTTYDITVYPVPDQPEVSIDLADCNPYTVVLSATANEPGSFVWSDGQSGAVIIVTHGGPYRVTFFNQYGCSSSTEVDVPQNPQAYIWAYPQGCYEICEGEGNNSLYVTGPSIPFDWEWQMDTNVIQSGAGVMPNEHWIGDGFYQLQLGSGDCTLTSPGFSWNRPERCVNCDLFINLINISPRTDANGNCYYVIDLYIYNHGALSYVMDNLTNTGVMIPGAGYLPGGPSSMTLEFYPPDNFVGGNVDFNMIANGKDAFPPYMCLNYFSIVFPPCPPGSSRPAGEPPVNNDQEYSVFPNPTSGSVHLTYPEGNSALTLYIYDFGGREMKREVLHSGIGKATVDISAFSTGTYLLIVRKEEQTVFYNRIILNR